MLGGVLGGDSLICSSMIDGVKVQNESVLKLYSLVRASSKEIDCFFVCLFVSLLICQCIHYSLHYLHSEF